MIFMGKFTISMVIFHSDVTNYQRVPAKKKPNLYIAGLYNFTSFTIDRQKHKVIKYYYNQSI